MKTIEQMTITQKSISAKLPDGAGTLTDEEIGRLQSHIGKLMELEFERAFGIRPTLPTTIQLQSRKCSCVIIHRSDCKFNCVT